LKGGKKIKERKRKAIPRTGSFPLAKFINPIMNTKLPKIQPSTFQIIDLNRYTLNLKYA